MENKLIPWLIDTVESLGISYRRLSMDAGLSPSYVSKVVSGERPTTADFCLAIARPLKENPAKLLTWAGYLPPQPPAVAEEQEIINTIRRLPPHARRLILHAMRGLAQDIRPVERSMSAQQRAPPEEGKEMETPLLGKAVLNPNHPIRKLYDTLAEVLSDEQFAHLIMRLAEQAAENQAGLGQTNGEDTTGRNELEHFLVVPEGGRRSREDSI